VPSWTSPMRCVFPV